MTAESDLLEFIKGTGKYEVLGRGITTYPNAVDENQMKIHAGCLILESEGKIKRHLVTDSYIVWMPNDENSTNL